MHQCGIEFKFTFGWLPQFELRLVSTSGSAKYGKFSLVLAYLKSGIIIRFQYLTIIRCKETTNNRFPWNFFIIHSHHSCHAIGFLALAISNYHQWFPSTFLDWYPVYAYKSSIVLFNWFYCVCTLWSLPLKFLKYNIFESQNSSGVVTRVFLIKMVDEQDNLTVRQCLLDAEMYIQTLIFPDDTYITRCK